MNDKLLSIIEKYKSRAGDGPEQDFMDKHTENVSILDGPGYAEIRKASDATQYHVRKPQHGNDAGDDEAVYEEYAEAINEAVEEFLEEATEEERETLEELFSTEEGYDEFVSYIFEEKDDEDDEEDEDDDEEEDDDDDDEVIDASPKIKKEGYGKKYKK